MANQTLAALFQRRAQLAQQEQQANPDMARIPAQPPREMMGAPSGQMGMPMQAGPTGQPMSGSPIPQGAIQNPLMSQQQFGNPTGSPRMTPAQMQQLAMLLRARGMQ